MNYQYYIQGVLTFYVSIDPTSFTFNLREYAYKLLVLTHSVLEVKIFLKRRTDKYKVVFFISCSRTKSYCCVINVKHTKS